MPRRKTNAGRKKDPDKKELIGIYIRPSEMELLGGKDKVRDIMFNAVERAKKNAKK